MEDLRLRRSVEISCASGGGGCGRGRRSGTWKERGEDSFLVVRAVDDDDDDEVGMRGVDDVGSVCVAARNVRDTLYVPDEGSSGGGGGCEGFEDGFSWMVLIYGLSGRRLLSSPCGEACDEAEPEP